MEHETEPDGIGDTMGYYALLNVSATATDEDIKRAYREKVQVFHPDKQADEAGKATATASFIRLQDAYEVLTDVKKRETYDVYGRKGLEAGLQVSPYQGGKSQEETRAEWAQYQAQSSAGDKEDSAESQEAAMNVNGNYVIRVDATSLVRPYDKRILTAPEISSTTSAPTVNMTLTPSDHLTFGVQSGTKKGVGGSSFVAGYQRILTPLDTLDISLLVGLQNLVQVTSTRQFGNDTTASLTATWQPDAGPGLQLATQRKLWGLADKWAAEATLMIGPQDAHGIAVAFTRHTVKTKLVLKLEMGLSTGISLRYHLRLTPKVWLRAHTRLGLAGLEAEAGVMRRLRYKTAAGFAVHLGSEGVTARLTVARLGQQLQVPILLSSDSQDWAVLFAASVVPPLVGTAVHFGILRPLFRRYRLSQAMTRRREGLEQLRQDIAAAISAQRLLHPVGFRRAVQLAAKGGLVIVEAMHGREEVMPPPCSGVAAAPHAHPAAPTENGEAAAGSHYGGGAGAAAAPWSDNQSDEGDDAASTASSATSSGGLSGHSRAARAATTQAEEVLTAAGELPPQWLDVTAAVRYMVAVPRPSSPPGASSDGAPSGSSGNSTAGSDEAAELGKLVLHNGVRKSGLMGFADVAPKEDKILRVAFLYQGVPYLANLLETQSAELPGSDGREVIDDDVAQHIFNRAMQQELLADAAP